MDIRRVVCFPPGEKHWHGASPTTGMTHGIGADSVLECVGTQESMMQAIRSTRPGGSMGYVGVPHGVTLDGADLFFRHVRLLGGPAPVRRYLPALIDAAEDDRVAQAAVAAVGGRSNAKASIRQERFGGLGPRLRLHGHQLRLRAGQEPRRRHRHHSGGR